MSQPNIPGGALRTSLSNLTIGDYINCEYTAGSNKAGLFSNLGSATKAEIPITGTASPNGTFYWIKVAPGTLIADRVVQTAVSWDVLNFGNYIQGNLFLVDDTDALSTAAFSTSSSYSVDYGASKAFNNVASESNGGWQTANNVSTNQWIKVDFGTAKAINKVRFQNDLDATYGPLWAAQSFRIEASADDVTWITQFTGTGNNTAGAWIYSSFTPTASFRYWRIFVVSNFGGQVIAISEIQMSSATNDINVRSLTGGTAYLDEGGHRSTLNRDLGAYPSHNEWDTYVAGSTLGGKITAGDNNVWNYGKQGQVYADVASTTSNITPTAPFTYNFPSPTAVKSLRFIRTGSGDQTMTEIRVWSNGVNIASTATVTNFGGAFVNSGIPGLFDGNLTTYVWDDTQNTNEYIELTFNEEVVVSGFQVYGHDSWPIRGMAVQKSNMGNFTEGYYANWTTNTPHLTLGANTTRVVRGYGNARSFNGSTDRINFSSVIIPSGNKTISFKIRVSSIPSAFKRICSTGIVGSDIFFNAYIRPSGTATAGFLSFAVGKAATTVWYAHTGSNICDDHWHDITIIVDNTNQTTSLYLDNVLITDPTCYVWTTGQADDTTYSRNLVLGCTYATASSYQEFSTCVLDEFKVYNAIQQMVLYLPMNEESGNVTDQSGNGYTGTATGTTVVAKSKVNGFAAQATTSSSANINGFRPVLKYTE